VGFSAGEFLRARAAACARFQNDDTAHPVWAVENVREMAGLGARDVGRALAEEALARTDPSWSLHARRAVQRLLVELTDDASARLEEEGKRLLGDPTDVEQLARVAGGALVLPGWTAGAAAQVLAMMQPWRPSVRLGDVARRWREHPWWHPVEGNALDTWSTLRRQHFSFDASRKAVPDGAPRVLPLVDAVDAAQRVLGVADVAVFIRGLLPGVTEAREGVIVSVDGDTARVRGMAHLRQADGVHEHHWTWLWTGQGLEGAVVVARLAAPFDVKAASVEVHVTWLGEAASAERLACAFLEQNAHVRTAPASEGQPR
jgi:hypothetical protein